MQLNFQTFGTGFPLLILHGLFGSSDNWHTISRRLGREFQVFAVDLRNHGRSPHSVIMDYEVMAGDIAEFLQAHRLPQAHVLGHSLGGKVAMRFALRHPDQVARLIVADMAPRAYPPSHLPIFEALRSLDLASFHNRNEMDAALVSAIPEPSVRQFLLKNVTRTDTGAFGWKLNLPAIEANYPKLLQAIDDDAPFPGPVLFIRGGQSDYIQDTDHASILRLFPQASFKTLPNAGHWIHAEAPEEFFQLVTGFFKISHKDA